MTEDVAYEMQEDGKVLATTLCLFDTGSDGGALSATFDANHSLQPLVSKSINMRTVLGAEEKDYERRKVPYLSNY